MLLGIFNLHACAFIYDIIYRDMSAISKKKKIAYLTDCSDVIFEAPKSLKNPNFPGPLGSLL